jgi:hypothetical protein
MQCAIQRTAHSVETVHALHGFKGLFWRHQPHSQVDATYYEHAFFCFHLASHFSHELPVARINVTRIQRASEGAQHSTGSRGDHVVDRGGVRLRQFGWVDLVMLGNGPVDAKDYRLRFTG